MTRAPAGPGQHQTLADRVLTLIARHGSPEEKQLVRPCEGPIRAFLDHPAVQLASGRTELDVGLENTLALKFNLVATGRGSPWTMVDQVATWYPALREVSELVIRDKLRCHVGFKVSRAGLEYELYPTETPDKRVGARAGIRKPEETGLPVAPYCYGFSSTGQVSAYARIDDVPLGELEEAVGFRIAGEGLKTRALLHSRKDSSGQWHPGKAGIELLPFPSHLLNDVLQHFHLHFAYLLHRGGSRSYGVIGIQGTRQVFYTTLVPRPPLVGWPPPPPTER